MRKSVIVAIGGSVFLVIEGIIYNISAGMMPPAEKVKYLDDVNTTYVTELNIDESNNRELITKCLLGDKDAKDIAIERKLYKQKAKQEENPTNICTDEDVEEEINEESVIVTEIIQDAVVNESTYVEPESAYQQATVVVQQESVTTTQSSGQTVYSTPDSQPQVEENQTIEETIIENSTQPVEEIKIEEPESIEVKKEIIEEDPIVEETPIEISIPDYSIGSVDGNMKGYYCLSQDDFYYNLQSYIDQGYIVNYGNYFAGHNPGAMGHLSNIDIGSTVRVSYNGTYRDFAIVDRTTGTGSFADVNFPTYGNLWELVLSDSGIIIQFCVGGQNNLFYGL